MGFPTAIASNDVDYLSTMQFATDCYLLVWGNEVVFKARVNQATFAYDFASITWDTATVGAYTDALEGYSVWLSATDDIRAAYNKNDVLRLRSVATATTLPINYTSIQPSDNDYIFVTKDVRPSMKAPKSLSLIDYNTAYRHPPPTIYNLSTVYFAQIDADGYADVELFEPEANAITASATISSWAWSADGGTFIVGSAATQDVQLRYTTPGCYMPRVTVTDSNGLTSWFTPYVFVAPNDLSSVVKLRFQDLNISATVDNGWNASVPFWDGVQFTLNGTLCAIYMPHATAGNKVLHCGRIRTESTDYTASGRGAATFNIEGIASQMNNLRAVSWRFVDTATSTTFNHITNLTPWRMLGRYIRDFTNINNTHSLEYSDTSDDYRYLSYYIQQGTTLDSLRDQLWSINADIEFSSDGMMKMIRHSRYIPTADRAALTTVAAFEFKHYTGKSIDDVMYSLELDHSYQVGKAITGDGWYNTTSGDVSVVKGTTPAVLPTRGTEDNTTDRQILKANLSRANAEIEARQRTRNDLAAKQMQPTIRMMLPGGFMGKLNPSISQLYSHTITVSDGIRLITYASTDKWLLSDLTIGYIRQFGSVSLDCTFQLMSDDLKYSIDIQDPPAVVPYSVPVMPPMDAYKNLPLTGGLTLPDSPVVGDEQPVTKKDKEGTTGASDPGATAEPAGNVLMVWNASQVFLSRDFSRLGATWLDTTPGSVSGSFKECVWDSSAASREQAYAVSNDATDSYVYRNPALGQIQTWQDTTLTGIEATQIRVNAKGNAIIYGIHEIYAPAGGFPISGLEFYEGTDDMSGDGESDILPSSHVSLTQPASAFPGVYNSTYQVMAGGASVAGNAACVVEWPIPPGVRITSISLRVWYYMDPLSATAGQKRISIEGDNLEFGNQTVLATGEQHVLVTDTTNMPIEPGTQSHLYFHASVNKKVVDDAFCHIEGILIEGTAAADYAATQLSTDSAATFDPAKSVGEMALGIGSFDVRYNQTFFAARDTQVMKSILAGLVYQDETNGAVEAGQFPAALWHFGRTTDTYLTAPDGGTVGLYKSVDGGAQTDITPNDGSDDGFVLGPGCIAMSNVSDEKIWFLGNFNGSNKLAYSTDLGSNWSVNTDPTAAATWMTVNPRGTMQVYVTDGGNILYSEDGGATTTTVTGPAADLLGVAVL